MDKTQQLHEQHEISIAEQRQKSMPYSEANPSEVNEIFFIYAERKVGTYHPTSPNSGKWLIFVTVDKVDEVWKQIKQATEEGLLGASAKVTTALPNPITSDPSKKVICVYTYDWMDEEDVMRVRAVLHDLGHTQKLAYKSDQSTGEGQYQARGHRRISKYYL